MSNNELTQAEYTFVELLPATAPEIADAMDISFSYVYDLVAQLRSKGEQVEQDSDGRYYLDEQVGTDIAIQGSREDSDTKAAITRKAKTILSELEYNLIDQLESLDPAIEDGGPTHTPGNSDIIIHRTDDHFGEMRHNQAGDVVHSTDIAAERVRAVFNKVHQIADTREAMGEEIDTVHLLLGGDIVTGESIYDGQSHEIDMSLQDQIDVASSVYVEQIQRLAESFPSVQVVCQEGNHGRLGSGNPSNADSILYMLMDKVIRQSGYDNVTFVQTANSYYVDFSIRDWSAHLRHGHDSSLEHIGTSAGKQRWLNWLVTHDFDIAFRGHYHMYKEEPINGRPVHMGGSIVPNGEFEESHALSGRPVGAIHGATDSAPSEWTEKIYFD